MHYPSCNAPARRDFCEAQPASENKGCSGLREGKASTSSAVHANRGETVALACLQQVWPRSTTTLQKEA